MLLLLLGILFLHVAVLVLLFVSTIVSVSAGGQGRLLEGRQLFLLWDSRCQTGMIFAEGCTSQRPRDIWFCTFWPPASFQSFEKVGPELGVG